MTLFLLLKPRWYYSTFLYADKLFKKFQYFPLFLSKALMDAADAVLCWCKSVSLLMHGRIARYHSKFPLNPIFCKRLCWPWYTNVSGLISLCISRIAKLGVVRRRRKWNGNCYYFTEKTSYGLLPIKEKEDQGGEWSKAAGSRKRKMMFCLQLGG